MNRTGKGMKNRLIVMVLIGAMMLSGMPVSAAKSPEEESTVEPSSSEAFEETAEDSEVEQKAPETEEADGEEAEEETKTITEKESTIAPEKKSETATETESIYTECEETQTEEPTSDLEAESRTIASALMYASPESTNNMLTKYNLEGYAASCQVTGGGLLTADDNNYYIANTEREFLDALAKASSGNPIVIEITKDMELGNLELKDQGINIQGNYPPLLHPTLLKTGVSKLNLNVKNLTIFSKNGSAIKHCGITFNGAKNLIIRNIVFDELWEWDEATAGEYDLNDWDYITILRSDGIWIDHCTFYKAYDGVVDIKNPANPSNVTVSWCRFLPGSKDDTFFNEMMDYLDKNNMSYYSSFLSEGLTKEQIRQYAYGQKKTSLLGQNDNATDAVGIKLTLANNYYLDSMERLPRLRYGTVHEYNCVLDSQDLYDWRAQSEILKERIASNGAISTCDGHMLLENCYIKGIQNPLVSGNAQSRPGYINAVDSVYYIGDTDKTDELVPRNNNDDDYTGSREVLVTDPEEFLKALPYSDYVKYPAESLNRDIVPFTGAGQLTMSAQQWEKTKYDDGEIGSTEESGEEENSSTEENSSEESSSEESSSTEQSGIGESSSTEQSSDSTENSGIQIVGLNKRVYEYTGEKIIPEFDVYDGDRLLSPGVDYTVTYKNNKNPGTATIIVKGKGNYAADKKNEAKATFEIIAVSGGEQIVLADIKGAKISKLDDVFYNPDGTPYNPPIIELTLKNKTKVSYKYNDTKHTYEKEDGGEMDVTIAVSNNVNKGTASVLVSGVDDKGKPVSIKGKFKINPLDFHLNEDKMLVEATDAVYAINGAVPKTLKVTYNEKALIPGKDYTVKFTNNKKAQAQATVIVTGKGNYTNKVSKTYTVEKANMSDFKVAAVTAHDGIKQAGKIKATVVDQNGNALNAKQYQLEIYHVDENEGVKTKGALYGDAEPLAGGAYIFVRAVPKDTLNFKEGTATAEAEFKIGIDISKAKFTLKKGLVKPYTGSAITLEASDFDSEKVTIKVNGETKKLTMGTDYEIVPYAYANNVNKGTATAVIRGIGEYSGTKTIKFKITQKAIANIELRDALRSIWEQTKESIGKAEFLR